MDARARYAGSSAFAVAAIALNFYVPLAGAAVITYEHAGGSVGAVLGS